MKTQILRLEAHDDVVSARDKMGWNQATRILLVWPERGRVLTRRIDLILLKRHSLILGAQLALITRDSDALFNARELNIPVFKNLNQAQKSHWRTNRQSSSLKRRFKKRLSPSPDISALRQLAHPEDADWRSKPFVRVGFFCLSVLALLSVAAVLLPGASVEIIPRTREQDLTLEVHANPDLDAINLSGAVPAKPVAIIIQGSATRPAHGVIQIPDKTASGFVSFSNLTDQPVTVPQGSIVRTGGDSPVRFLVIQTGIVPAGLSGTAILPVRAIEPGTSGNLPSGSLVIMEGPLGTKLTAENPNFTSGGTSRSVPAPTEDDQHKLYDQLLAELSQKAVRGLETMISPADLILTPTLTVTHVIESTYDPSEGQPADELRLDIRLEFRALRVSSEDINSLVNSILDANIPPGFVPIHDSLTVKNLSTPLFGSDQMVHWRLQGQRSLEAHIPEIQAKNLILGLTPDLAHQRLIDALPLQGTPEIQLIPGWWPRLPLLPFRIQVKSQ